MGILKVLLRYTLPVFVVLFGIGGCFFLFQSRPESAQKPPKPPAALVETAKAVKQPVTFRVQSQGSVSPRTQTTLIPEVSGEIVEVSPQFISGGFFSKGDILVKIDPSNYETALKRANAAVKRAETQVATDDDSDGSGSLNKYSQPKVFDFILTHTKIWEKGCYLKNLEK